MNRTFFLPDFLKGIKTALEGTGNPLLPKWDILIRPARAVWTFVRVSVQFEQRAYCKARQRLPLDLIHRLVQSVGETLEQDSPVEWQ